MLPGAIFYVGGATVVGLVMAAWAAYDRIRRQAQELAQFEARVATEAQKQAEQIIAQARSQALKIVSQASTQAQAERQEFQQGLAKITGDQLAELKKVAAAITQEVRQGAVKQVDEFTRALEMETGGAQDIVAKKIAEHYSQAEIEAAKHREMLLRRAEGQVFDIIQDVAQRVIGDTLDLGQHQKLVYQALEEAKKRHVL